MKDIRGSLSVLFFQEIKQRRIYFRRILPCDIFEPFSRNLGSPSISFNWDDELCV